MTRLFIDGQEVVLPEQFELELITENPYFTRTGEYTYDIDIDLKVPQNRQIYKNIQRSEGRYIRIYSVLTLQPRLITALL